MAQSPGKENFSVYLPPANEVWGKVIFSVACVKNSVHRGDLPQCMLGYHSRSRHPPPSPEQSLPPQEQTPLGSRHPPEQTSPGAVHAGRYRQQAGSIHPTGMQSCLITINIHSAPKDLHDTASAARHTYRQIEPYIFSIIDARQTQPHRRTAKMSKVPILSDLVLCREGKCSY